jgi:hypothetical protein
METDISKAFQGHLDANEKLIWTGQPKKGIVFRTADFFLIPFSLFWCGFAIFWFVSALCSGVPFFALFGVPFVIIGLFYVFGRFIIDAKQRANTFYALTEERIIIKSGVYKISIKSLNLRTLTDIELEEKSNGSGTISFGPKNPLLYWRNRMNWMPAANDTPALELIEDARRVYKLIVDLHKPH